MSGQYRLPDGKLTTDFAVYSNAWQKLAEPIEKATGTKLTGFDPALSFATPDFKCSFQLGLFEAKLLSAALESGAVVVSAAELCAKAIDTWEHTSSDDDLADLHAHRDMLDRCEEMNAAIRSHRITTSR
jgi:hypothetical protein